MSEEEQTSTFSFKHFLKQPSFYFIVIGLLYLFFLWPLLQHQEAFYPFLSEKNFDLLCKLAVNQDLVEIVCLTYWSIILVSFCMSVVFLFRRKFKKAGEYFFVLIFVLIFCPAPLLGPGREGIKRRNCQYNLVYLHSVMSSYSNEYGVLPPDLKVLKEKAADRDAFLCPTRLKNSIPEYKYYGKGRRLNEDPPFLLMEEVGKNHVGKYRNRLYSDGTVKH